VATRSERISGNLVDARLLKAEKKSICFGEAPFNKEMKWKEASRESDETIVLFDDNKTYHYRREGSLLNEMRSKNRKSFIA